MGFQKRDKYFFVREGQFPSWPYNSRNAIGVNLFDFKARDSEEYRFQVGDKMHKISREKAITLGKIYQLPFGRLPHLIPLEEFETEIIKQDMSIPVPEQAVLL